MRVYSPADGAPGEGAVPAGRLRRHEPPGSPERPARLEAARAGARAAEQAGAEVTWAEAPPATRRDALLVHEAAVIERLDEASRAGGEWIEPDTFVGPGSVEAALAALGAAIAAARSAAAGTPAFALARPPGHHATRRLSMGFCLLNSVAVAAESLAREGKRVAIVDVDVHHGNGTQDVFEARDDVLYASLHEWPLYPGTGRAEEIGIGRGEGFTLNLPLPAGTGHGAWLEVFDAAVVPVVRTFAPGAILVSAGFDAHARDPLGHLRLVAGTFHAAVSRLFDVTPRVACILEGGYDLEAIRRSVTATVEALARRPCSVREDVPPGPSPRPWPILADRVRAAHGKRWPI